MSLERKLKDTKIEKYMGERNAKERQYLLPVVVMRTEAASFMETSPNHEELASVSLTWKRRFNSHGLKRWEPLRNHGLCYKVFETNNK